MCCIEKIKMAKSRTSKKQIKRLAYEMAQAQVVENLFNFYLTWWSKQEIHSLVKNNSLVILPLDNNGLQIAYYTVFQRNNSWHVTSARNDKQFIFTDRMSAIFYCLFEYKKLYNRSAEILYQDNQLRKLENDEKFYRHKYSMALNKHDQFKQDLWESRLSEAVPKLNLARDQLQKMIKRAKYIKIWD
jgi:hypothetical protein